ncbi:sulfotransferase domain-containing protein [Vannielia sp.]|uniref:sulfotransferase domain-containing protein n=1 Tax=Vannielia sp. TaxID=2813045 RepID=UPI0026121168|nr:sulfotransferase domain-containing protein [Vannielia sp.]MDF1871797.1 sulfotransferase domain-containing protein [Vannielia sp.]
MPRLMCFATHHKSGTVWIRRTVQAMSAAFGTEWHGIWRDGAMWKVPDEGEAFLVNWAGWFPEALWERDDVGFVHLIRDPRDMLLSGCVYHHHAGDKGEKWLHEPRAAFGGKSYQQHLNAIEGERDKLLFSMRGKHRETVQEMLNWRWGDPRITELRYEDLMQDHACHLFQLALAHLGLEGDRLEKGRSLFWEQSLFGGMADIDKRPRHLHGHVHSEGALKRWEKELPRAVGEAYAAEFGDALKQLGYEQDDSWVDRLPETPADLLRETDKVE